jgi:hypothetical protein
MLGYYKDPVSSDRYYSPLTALARPEPERRCVLWRMHSR